MSVNRHSRAVRMVLAALVCSAVVAQAGRETRRTRVVDVVEEAGPAVVNITARSTRTVIRPIDPFGMFGQLDQRTRESLGSGVLVDPQGYVLTNYHVVGETNNKFALMDKVSEVSVVTQSGEEYQAELVGVREAYDLAVLKINGEEPFPYVELAAYEEPLIGETVIAVGNPYGLNNTVTVGVISALHRTVETPWGKRLTGLIQTDAAINRGNSGGPLLNVDGELIGINTSIISESGGSQGIGFAVSALCAHRMYERYVLKYLSLEARVGLQLIANDPRIARRYNIPGERGCAVWQVETGGYGDLAGIVPGDVITAVNGKACETPTQFVTLLTELGDNVESFELSLVRRKSGEAETLTIETQQAEPQQVTWRGMVLESLTPRMADQLNLSNNHGVHVRSVLRGSRAFVLGIRPDDVIYEVNDKHLKSMEDFLYVAEQTGDNDNVRVRVKRPQLRGGAKLYRGTI